MSNKLQKIAVIAAIVIVFGGFLTFLMTWRNIGFSEGFLFSWLTSFALCVVCIAPIGGVISYLVHHLVNYLFPNLTKLGNSLVFGLFMAIIMESIMAIVTTINVHGFIAVAELTVFWLQTFAAALPAGLAISVLMSIMIKPRLVAFLAK